MSHGGHTAAQQADLQAQYTKATNALASVPAGQNTVTAWLNTQRMLLQDAVAMEGEAKLT